MEKESIRKVEYKLKPDSYYYNKDGLLVYTRAYHLERGYCCKSGCLHCPYDFKRKNR